MIRKMKRGTLFIGGNYCLMGISSVLPNADFMRQYHKTQKSHYINGAHTAK